jgi:hypothetical protein
MELHSAAMAAVLDCLNTCAPGQYRRVSHPRAATAVKKFSHSVAKNTRIQGGLEELPLRIGVSPRIFGAARAGRNKKALPDRERLSSWPGAGRPVMAGRLADQDASADSIT